MANKPAVPVNPAANMEKATVRSFVPPDGWKSELLPAGILRAVHVLTPALQERLKDKTSTLPVIAVRSSNKDYSRMRLYRWVEILGPSFIGEIFDQPLPGTNGRAVAVLFSEYPLQVWIDPANDLGVIETAGKTPDEILAECKARIEAKKKPARKPVRKAALMLPSPKQKTLLGDDSYASYLEERR